MSILGDTRLRPCGGGGGQARQYRQKLWRGGRCSARHIADLGGRRFLLCDRRERRRQNHLVEYRRAGRATLLRQVDAIRRRCPGGRSRYARRAAPAHRHRVPRPSPTRSSRHSRQHRPAVAYRRDPGRQDPRSCRRIGYLAGDRVPAREQSANLVRRRAAARRDRARDRQPARSADCRRADGREGRRNRAQPAARVRAAPQPRHDGADCHR